ncbi:MAG TPA: hypothetical protein VN692_03720 [Steroidobacteraceae bacterium]|nr:hypothetical protein [Steroidobacteraceae bacterium]
MSIIGDLRRIAQASKDIMSSKRRALKQVEINEAKKVFLDTVNYDLIFIADKLGLDDRPFTLLHKKALSHDEYTLYMGKAIYDSNASLNWATFIHEMTHAWQGQNHWISSGYMLNSVISQALDGNTAYDYTLGQMWGEYNVEQQAHLVEDWYRLDRRSEASRRFYYIQNCIRKPWRAWVSDMFVDLTAGAAAMDR